MYKCELRPSLIHGRGVFACADYPTGTVMCLYDGETKTEKKESTFRIGEDFVGFSIPRSKVGIAQFINDAVAPDFSGAQTFAERFLACAQYQADSLARSNVIIEPRGQKIWAVTSRDVTKDTELLFSYDIGYWVARSAEISVSEGDELINRYMTEVILEGLNTKTITVQPFTQEEYLTMGTLAVLAKAKKHEKAIN
jgi:hypothetical protein